MGYRKALVGLAVCALVGQFVSAFAFSQEREQETLAIFVMHLPTEEVQLKILASMDEFT